jgi:hypothetical protein
METNRPIDAAEASAALATVQRSRAAVAWRGYPYWYWLATGAGMAAILYTINLPGDWALAATVVLGAALILITYAAAKARGICEGWVSRARPKRDALLLAGPMIVVMFANVFVSKSIPWSSIPAAILEFILFAGAGLLLSARAARL